MLVIIQARTSSERFKNKILYRVYGKPLIQHVIEKIKKSKADCIFSICESRKNPYFNMVEYKNNYLRIS